MCRDLSAFQQRVVSKCPARLIRFRDGAELAVDQVADVCVVRFGARPPSPLDAGWNAAQATLRVIDGASVLILSAVFNGQLVSECTVAIPLPAAS